MTRRYRKQVGLPRSFLEGRTMGEAVKQERQLVVSNLIEHDLIQAANATNAPRSGSFNDFMTMRGVMLAGGIRHLIRSGLKKDFD